MVGIALLDWTPATTFFKIYPVISRINFLISMATRSPTPSPISCRNLSSTISSRMLASLARLMMQYLNGVKNRITFKEPKSKKSRRLIALSPSTVFVLEEHQKAQENMRESLELPPITENDLVFSHWDGSPLLPDSITHAWIKLVRKCGLRGIRLHDARHTHATIMLKQGVHPKIVVNKRNGTLFEPNTLA